jgi:hypothetical protein
VAVPTALLVVLVARAVAVIATSRLAGQHRHRLRDTRAATLLATLQVVAAVLARQVATPSSVRILVLVALD